MTQQPGRAWHAESKEQIWSALNTTAAGLSGQEAARRLEHYGPNALLPSAVRHPLFRFLAHFNSALIYFLLAASLAATLLGHLVDAGVILAVVLVNAVVGFVQEGADGTVGSTTQRSKSWMSYRLPTPLWQTLETLP